MKVLMLSGDPNLLKTGAETRERFALQKSSVEQLDVFVWPHVHRYRDIRRAAHLTHYDVITSQDPFWRGLISWYLSRKTGARLNLQVHADLAGQSLAKRVLARFLLRRADSIRAQSERVATEVRKLGVRAPVTILPVYVDVARVTGVPRAPTQHSQKTILWVGRFETEKDPLRAISVLRQVRADGVDAVLVMLGSGSLEGELRKAAHNLPVEFPGWQQPAAYLAVADIVLSTSPYESYGASIVEALAAGVPVVSRDVGVAREAGATVTSKEGLAEAAARVLRSGARGELKLSLLDASEWAEQWRATLI